MSVIYMSMLDDFMSGKSEYGDFSGGTGERQKGITGTPDRETAQAVNLEAAAEMGNNTHFQAA